MSLINEMLQELDKRTPLKVDDDAWRNQVRSVPRRAQMRWGWWGTAVAALVIAVTAAWLWLRASPPAPPTPAQPTVAPGSSAVTAQVVAPVTPLIVPSSPLPAGTKPGDVSPIQPRVYDAAATIAKPDSVSASRAMNASAPVSVTQAVAAPSTESDVPARVKAGVDPPRDSVRIPAANKPPAASASAQRAPAQRPAVEPQREPAAAESNAVNKLIVEFTPQQQAERRYRDAISLLQTGRAAEASQKLDEALLVYPKHGAARTARAGIFVETGHLDDAMRILAEGLTLDAAQPAAAMMLARIQVEKSDAKTAVDTLHRALPHAADRPDYLAFLAALEQRQGEHAAAIEHFRAALAKTPQNGVWWMGLGISLQAENRLPDARDAFKRAGESNALSAELRAFVQQSLAQVASQAKQ